MKEDVRADMSLSAENGSADQYLSTEHLRSSLGQRAARGGAFTMISQVVTFVISLGATAVMARLLTPQDYGLIGMVAVLTNFVSMFKDLGLSTATIQKDQITGDQISTLFWLNVALGAGVMAVAAALSPIVAWFYGDRRLLAITLVTSIGLLISGLAVQHEALLRRQMRFLVLSVISLASVIVGYIVGITFAWFRFSYWALVFSQLGLVAFNTIAIWCACRWRPGWPRLGSGVGSMVRFGGNLTGFTIINYFSRNLDNLLIGRVWGAFQLGIYSRAYQLMMVPIDQVNTPITSVAVPALSRLNDRHADYRKAYLRMIEKVAILTMPGVALMIGCSDWVIRIVLGPQWHEASRIFILLGITGLVQPIANTTGWLFLSQGRSDRILKWGMISGPLIIASIIIGLPWGAFGVAATYSAVRVLITEPLLFWFVGRTGPIRTMDFYTTIAPFLFAAGCVLLAILGFRRLHMVANPVLGIAICSGIALVTDVIALSSVPAGRAALRDLKTLTLMLGPQKGKEALANRSS
jgi:O-antigen/teichoic acid export membrane protein